METKLQAVGCLLLLLLSLTVEAMVESYLPELIEQVTSIKTAPLALYVDPLPTPRKINSVDHTSLTIGMYKTTQKFHRDLPTTPIFAYGSTAANAAFPGPTIVATRNVPTYVTWVNNLPSTHILPWDTTITPVPPHGGVPAVVHLHGGVVSPENDGHAFAWYTANYTDVGSTFTRRTYVYPNVQHSGNLMYHDHAAGLTRINLLAGLLGAYVIVEPTLDTSLNLPSGNEFDQHLVIADRSFNTDGSIYMNPVGAIPSLHPSWNPEYYGDAITVNGKIWPFLTVKRRKYRFRILNASNARYYNLTFSANGGSPYSFAVIGSDGSYLPAPVYSTSIVLSVAETFDVVFDFSKVVEAEIELINSAPYPYPTGTVPSGSLTKVMKFVITPGKTGDSSTIPPTLVNYLPAKVSDATVTRYLGLFEYTDSSGNTKHLLINGKKLTDPATEKPKSGSVELWNMINLTPDDHPLHLHLAKFQSMGSQPVLNLQNFTTCMQSIYDPILCNLQVGAVVGIPNYEKTWKNIVKMPPGYMTSVLVRFDMVDNGKPYPFDATAKPGYVYHCHILDHEDNEMIRPLLLTP